MAVIVHFRDDGRGPMRIESGVTLDEPVAFSDRVRVVNSGGKTIAMVVVSAMSMIEIVESEEGKDDPDDAATTPSAD